VKQDRPTPSDTIRTIRTAGARATPARVRVLDLLHRANRALSHQDIESGLGSAALDRVTIYRVLDWLVETGLAHKTVDARRISRFSPATLQAQHDSHAHFRCDRCGRVFCLDAALPAPPRLPAGFRIRQLDLSVRGDCAQCVQGT